MKKKWWESFARLLCENGYLLIFLILIFVLLLFSIIKNRYLIGYPPNIPTPIIFDGTLVPTANIVSSPTLNPLTKIPTTSPIPKKQKPEMVIVFVPVNWSSSIGIFNQAALEQFNLFVNESEIEKYISVRMVILEEGPNVTGLSHDEYNYALQDFVIGSIEGDRFIGLTDEDLCLGNECNISGWSDLSNSVMVEYNNASITAHELGHTFGLCDEYNYKEWNHQNKYIYSGCPNPFPSYCKRDLTDETPYCDGAFTEDGRYSIMTYSGLEANQYGFNKSSLDHLESLFKDFK